MPITINDCRCGSTPVVESSEYGFDFNIICPEGFCDSTPKYHMEFDVAVERWNAANPRKPYSEMMNKCKCGGRPVLTVWHYESRWSLRISCEECYQTFDAGYDGFVEDLIATWNEANPTCKESLQVGDSE